MKSDKKRPKHICERMSTTERVYINLDGSIDYYQGQSSFVYNIYYCPRCGMKFK